MIVFQKNLIDVYQEYIKIYGESKYLTKAFNHVIINHIHYQSKQMHLDPEKADTDQKKVALNFIVEIGFITYSILNKLKANHKFEIEFDHYKRRHSYFATTSKQILMNGVHW